MMRSVGFCFLFIVLCGGASVSATASLADKTAEVKEEVTLSPSSNQSSTSAVASPVTAPSPPIKIARAPTGSTEEESDSSKKATATTTSSNTTASAHSTQSSKLAAPTSNESATTSNTSTSGVSTKGSTNVTNMVPGQQDKNYANSSLSQWDVTNNNMINVSSLFKNHTNSTRLLPPEKEQKIGWFETCVAVFLSAAVVLFVLTGYQKYKKRRQYELAPEMETLIV